MKKLDCHALRARNDVAAGFTLMEALISLLLLSILLLGMDALQVMSLKQAKINYHLAAAEQQLILMTEKINLTHDTATWNQQNQQMLPQGRGEIDNNKITLYWGKTNASSCDKNKISTEGGCLQIHL